MPIISSNIPSVQQRGRLVFVDNRFGNNATGRIERADYPFATIEAAFNAALSAATNLNDVFTIHIRPGIYNSSGGMVKPANRSINFEAEAGVYLEILVPPGQSWLEIQGLNFANNPVYLNFDEAANIRTQVQGEAVFLLTGNSGSQGSFVLKCGTLRNSCLGPTSAFAKVPAGVWGSGFVDCYNLVNITSTEGQAFFRTDTAAAFANACEIYCRSSSNGRRIFLDTAAQQTHYFYSRNHQGTIAGDTVTDSPIWCELGDGTFISNLNSPTLQPLGIKPQTYWTQGKVSIRHEGLFIPNVLRNTSGFLPHGSGEFEWGGLDVNLFQPCTNNWRQSEGEVTATFHGATTPIPPLSAGYSGWLIQGQAIKGFRAAANFVAGGNTLRLGTQNLGPLTVPFPSASLSANHIEVPLATPPNHHRIIIPNDKLAIFNDTGNLLTYGTIFVTAELAKPI